jgi:hypothetical protein
MPLPWATGVYWCKKEEAEVRRKDGARLSEAIELVGFAWCGHGRLIDTRFDLYFRLKVRDHDISCQWRTARTPSRGLWQGSRGASIILT